MAIITTNEGSIIIDNGTISSEPKGTFSCKIVGDVLQLRSQIGVTYDLKASDTTVDGASFTDPKDLLDTLSSFSKGGGDGQGVTWEEVTDKPAVIAEGATQAEARNKIGAGTSNYSLPAGGSASNYLKGDGTWGTPANTTYSIITEAEFNTGTSNTGRTVSAQSLNRDILAGIVKYLQGLNGYAEGASLQVTANGIEWVTPEP